MKPSQLVAIIRRLEAMTVENAEVESRRFEREGVERCVVRYHQNAQEFELEESGTNESYQFDDIDLVAIEIYELLQA